MKKSLIIFGILYLLTVIVSVSVFAKPPKKYHKYYDCKLVGVQKVKPYHIKPIRHFGYIASKLGFRHRA